VVVGERNGYVEEMMVVVGGGEGMMRDLVMRRWWWMRDLIERSFMPMFLLTKNIKSVFHLCEPRSLPVNVLPVSFSMLDCGLPS
jgi:hypothetical protein